MGKSSARAKIQCVKRVRTLVMSLCDERATSSAYIDSSEFSDFTHQTCDLDCGHETLLIRPFYVYLFFVVILSGGFMFRFYVLHARAQMRARDENTATFLCLFAFFMVICYLTFWIDLARRAKTRTLYDLFVTTLTDSFT